MSCLYDAWGENTTFIQGFWWEKNLKEGDHLKDLGILVDRRILLKWIFKE
jgi:hypothetical protein